MTTRTKYLLKDRDGDIWIGKLSPTGSLIGCRLSNESLMDSCELSNAAHNDYDTGLKILREFQSISEMSRIFRVKIVPMIVKDGDA